MNGFLYGNHMIQNRTHAPDHHHAVTMLRRRRFFVKPDVGWEAQHDPSTAARLTCKFDRPSLLLAHAFYDGEPEAVALATVGAAPAKEALEHMRQIVGGDTLACILDFDRLISYVGGNGSAARIRNGIAQHVRQHDA